MEIGDEKMRATNGHPACGIHPEAGLAPMDTEGRARADGRYAGAKQLRVHPRVDVGIEPCRLGRASSRIAFAYCTAKACRPTGVQAWPAAWLPAPRLRRRDERASDDRHAVAQTMRPSRGADRSAARAGASPARKPSAAVVQPLFNNAYVHSAAANTDCRMLCIACGTKTQAP